MSFCYDVKKELCNINISKCCAISELYGILLFANTFNENEIKIITENVEVVKRTIIHFNRLINLTPQIVERENKNGKTYILSLTKSDVISRIIMSLGANISGVALRLDYKLLSDDCCKNSIIRGAFLSGGTISSPSKSYHLEFSTPRFKLNQDINLLLMEFDLSPKNIIRKSNYVTYFKDSGAIEDILNIMGAKKSEFEIMNTKIFKEIRNTANRVTNCETANISKTINASSEHKRAINELIKSGQFMYLTDELKKIAILRLENEDLSLSELGKCLVPPLSKSAINNRLKKIIQFLPKK